MITVSTRAPIVPVKTLGFRLPLDRPLVFDPHQLHGTCQWEGTRLVLAAYTINHFERLPQHQVDTLTQLGFVLPRFDTGDVFSEQTVPKPLQSACPVVFEIFCGAARIVRAMHSLGWSASQAADHVQKPAAEAPVLVADLSTCEGQGLMMFWMSCPYLVGVWLAPPCGTASLARLIPVVDSLGNVLPSPRPLRSLEWPEGVPGLSGVDLHRVPPGKPCCRTALGAGDVPSGPRSPTTIVRSTPWLAAAQAPLVRCNICRGGEVPLETGPPRRRLHTLMALPKPSRPASPVPFKWLSLRMCRWLSFERVWGFSLSHPVCRLLCLSTNMSLSCGAQLRAFLLCQLRPCSV